MIGGEHRSGHGTTVDRRGVVEDHDGRQDRVLGRGEPGEGTDVGARGCSPRWSGLGIWAVPVLPATVYPSMAALVPVPEETTDSSMAVSWALVVGSITRWDSEGAAAVTAPSGVDGGPDEPGGDEHPAVGHGVVGVEHLLGGDGVVLADRRRADRGAGPLGRPRDQPLGLTGDPEAGRLAESEIARSGWRSRVSPSSWATSMVPMFDDWARIWVAVSGIGAVLPRRRGTCTCPSGGRPARTSGVVGVTRCVGQGGRERHQLEHRARARRPG